MGSWFAQAIESGAWRERPADLLLVTDDAGRRDHVRPIRRGEADCFLQLVAGGWVRPHKDDFAPLRRNRSVGAPSVATVWTCFVPKASLPL